MSKVSKVIFIIMEKFERPHTTGYENQILKATCFVDGVFEDI